MKSERSNTAARATQEDGEGLFGGQAFPIYDFLFRAGPSYLDYLIHQAVMLGLLRRKGEIAVGILFDPGNALAGVLGEYLVQAVLHFKYLPRGYLHFRRLALHAAHDLVQEYLPARQREALALLARTQKHRAHGSRHAYANGGHVRFHVLDGVIDGESRGHHAARAVDVKLNVLLGVLVVQEQELGDDGVRDRIVDRPAQKDDALLQEARIDVIRPFSVLRFFYDRGYEIHVFMRS